MEEFCRRTCPHPFPLSILKACAVTQIPLDTVGSPEEGSRPPWVRPIRKKTRSGSVASPTQRSSHSPEHGVNLDFYPMNGSSNGLNPGGSPIDNYMDPNIFLTPEMMAIFSDDQNGLSMNAPFGTTSPSQQNSLLAGSGSFFKGPPA